MDQCRHFPAKLESNADFAPEKWFLGPKEQQKWLKIYIYQIPLDSFRKTPLFHKSV